MSDADSGIMIVPDEASRAKHKPWHVYTSDKDETYVGEIKWHKDRYVLEVSHDNYEPMLVRLSEYALQMLYHCVSHLNYEAAHPEQGHEQ